MQVIKQQIFIKPCSGKYYILQYYIITGSLDYSFYSCPCLQNNLRIILNFKSAPHFPFFQLVWFSSRPEINRKVAQNYNKCKEIKCPHNEWINKYINKQIRKSASVANDVTFCIWVTTTMKEDAVGRWGNKFCLHWWLSWNWVAEVLFNGISGISFRMEMSLQ